MDQENFPNTLPEGHNLHWYQIKSILGRGSFGITYLAHDKNLDRPVAIKEYLPIEFAVRHSNFTVQPMNDNRGKMYKWGLTSFLKETRTLAKFSHPNIMRVHSGFEMNNTAYMVMEYEHGNDLATELKKHSQFNQERLLTIFLPLLDGLSMVHQTGFIHRDIKPANIYIRDNGTPVLLDFGSARQTISDKTTNLTGLVTVGYAPFEQYNEDRSKQGPWTDIYSLGATLYFCITGNKPEDAIKRGTNIFLNKLDTYIPLAGNNKLPYTQHFLSATDLALKFYSYERPQLASDWASILTGEEPPNTVHSNTAFKSNSFDHSKDLSATLTQVPNSVMSNVARKIRDTQNGNTHPNEFNSTQNPSIKQNNLTEYKNKATTVPDTKKPSTNPITLKRMILSASVLVVMIAIFVIDWTQLVYLDWSTDDQAKIRAQKLDNESKISIHLAIARQKQKVKEFTKPVKDNAIYHFNQVLLFDPDNAAAKNGMQEIIADLKQQAEQDLKNKEFIKVQEKINLIHEHSLTIPDIMDLQVELELAKSRQEKIVQLLSLADSQFQSNNIITPKNDNAMTTYRNVLKLEPNNTHAFSGVHNIYKHYSEKIDKSLLSGQLELAAVDLKHLKKVNSAHASIPQFEKKLKLGYKRQFEDHIAYSRFEQAQKTIQKIKTLDPRSPLIDQMSTSLRLSKEPSQLNIGVFNKQ